MQYGHVKYGAATVPGFAWQTTVHTGRRTSLPDAIDRLRRFAEATAHSFWPDSVSLLDAASADPRHIGGSRQITDVYLLSLAVRNDGCLATFDRGIAIGSVPGARAEHLAVIG